MRIAVKRALYSGLIIPGWGQMANQQKVKGAIFMFLAIVVLCGFLIHLGVAFIDYAKALGDLADPETFISTQEMMMRFFKQMMYALIIWTPVGLAIWIASAADAYWTAKKVGRRCPG